MKSQSAFNSNLSMMPMVSTVRHHHHHHHLHPNFANFVNRNNGETMNNENRPIFDRFDSINKRKKFISSIFSLTRSPSAHGLDLSPFIDATNSNSNGLFPSPSSLNDSSSPTSINSVYQPSDIAALLESTGESILTDRKTTENSLVQDVTNTFTNSSALPTSNLQTSCSTAAAAVASAFLQENILTSLFDSFEPFNKYFPVDDSSNSSSSTSRYNALLTKSPLLTTAPEHIHHPMYYGHAPSWH